MNTTATIEHLVAKAGQFYSLPAVAVKVLELTDHPRIDMVALKECIENDPALTTKVLRVVNSALFGLSGEVSDLNQALALLGIKPLKLLVLGFSLPEGLFAGIEADMLGRYWRRTLTKAVTARELSGLAPQCSGDEAFIAGLLHNLGMLLLIQEMGQPYVRFLDWVRAEGHDLPSLERRTLGFTHTELTAKLLAQWGLPRTLVEAISRHEDTPHMAAGRATLGDVVGLAELVARLLVDRHPNALQNLLEAGRHDDWLSPQQLQSLVDRMDTKIEQLAEVLALELPVGDDCQNLLVEAHRKLTEVAADTVGDPAAYGNDDPKLDDEINAMSEAVTRYAQNIPADVDTPKNEVGTPDLLAEAPSGQGRSANLGALPTQQAHDKLHAMSTRAPNAIVSAQSLLRGEPTVPGRTWHGAVPHADLLDQLGSMIDSCRRSYCAVSLVLVELVDVERFTAMYGLDALQKTRRFLERIASDTDFSGSTCVPYQEAGFAVLLPNCERQPAARWANHLIDRIRRLVPEKPLQRESGVGLSAGVATLSVPTVNFPPEELFDAAARGLFCSHASGGGVVKSIDVY